QGPAAGPRRVVGRHDRFRRGPPAALLLSLRSRARPLRRLRDRHAARCRRPHGRGPWRLHRRGAGAREVRLMGPLPLFPEQASTMAGRVDALYFFLIGISIFFTLLIGALVIGFAVRYRRRSDDE